MNKSKLFISKNLIFEMNKSKLFILKNQIFEKNKSKFFISKNPIFEMNKFKLFILKNQIFEINKSKLKNPIFEKTGSPKNLSVLRAAAGLGSWCLARPAGRIANMALMWAEILAITAAMFPMVALRMPRGSASGEAMMVLDLMVSWKEETMQSTSKDCLGGIEDQEFFFGGNKHCVGGISSGFREVHFKKSNFSNEQIQIVHFKKSNFSNEQIQIVHFKKSNF